MKEKIKRSWEIIKACAAILRKDKKLFTFLVLNIGISLIFVGIILIPCFWLISGNFDSFITTNSKHIPFLSGLYFLSSFVLVGIPMTIFLTFISCAQAFCVLSGLRGKKISIQGGFRESLRQYKPILAWALLSALITPIVMQFQKWFPWIGNKIAAWAGITTWGVGTFFVIPILIFEKQTLKTSIQKSFGAMKSLWTEQLSFTAGNQILSVLTILPVTALFAWFVKSPNCSSSLETSTVLAVFVAYVLIVSSILGFFQQIYCAVLYTYAVTGMLPSEFSAGFFSNRRKKQ